GNDPRVSLINSYLSKPAMERLFADADILLSLQRSEGFGLNLARAMARGIPLITTAFGGHLDFCSEDSAFLIPWTLTDVRIHGDEFYTSGKWADPDEAAAVNCLREVVRMVIERDSELDSRRERGRRTIAERFSREMLKRRIAKLLGVEYTT